MKNKAAEEVANRWQRLRSERATLETQWQEIAELIRPMRADFTFTTPRIEGEKRMRKVFDGTPILAAENLAAGLWSMITNSANAWFLLRHPDPDIGDDDGVQRWLDAVARRMRDAFEANGQQFYARVLDHYLDLVCFGTGVFFVDEAEDGASLHFSNRALVECVIDIDDRERIDTVIRKFSWTLRQCMMRPGWEAKLPDSLRRAAEKEPHRKVTILHCVKPTDDYAPRRMDRRGKPWHSLYALADEGVLLQEGGYHEMPYMVPRWSLAARGLYGESPAMLALPDVKMLNVMEKTNIVAAQKAADPPLLAPDEDAVRSVRVTPGGITYGAVGPDGRPLVQPLITGANFNLSLEMIGQKREAVREQFYWSQMLMARQAGMTATEVMARQDEMLRLMGPHLGRIQAELLDPLIGRVFNLMWRAGAFPPPPDVLLEAPEIKVEYVSPLARAQRAGEATAALRFVEALGLVEQIAPGTRDNLDADAAARVLAEGMGVPLRMLRDPRVVAQQREAAAQAQAMQDPAAAKGFADTARGVRDLAQAQAAGQQQPVPA